MEEKNIVEVNWHGKTLYFTKDKMDEFYSKKSDEQRVEYINSHPEVKTPVNIYRSSDRQLQEPDDLVLVKWSGDKLLLLERQQLDDWYSGSYEDHVDFISKHPETLL
jgi:hypothetical protein